MNAPTHYPADEIDLVDLWLTFKRHLKLFIGVAAAAFTLAIVAALLLPRSYEYFATLQIGGFRENGELQLLEQPQALQAKLQEGVIPQIIATAPDSKAAQGYNIKASSPKNSDVIVLSATGPAGEAPVIEDLLQRIVQQVQGEHATVLEARLNESRALLQDDIAALETQLAAMQANRENLAETADKSDALAVLLLDGQIQAAQERLDGLRHQLRVDLLSNIRNTTVVTHPTRSLNPAGPGTLVMLALGGVLAVMFGCMAVMAAAFARAAATREAAQKEQAAQHESASAPTQLQPRRSDAISLSAYSTR